MITGFQVGSNLPRLAVQTRYQLIRSLARTNNFSAQKSSEIRRRHDSDNLAFYINFIPCLWSLSLSPKLPSFFITCFRKRNLHQIEASARVVSLKRKTTDSNEARFYRYRNPQHSGVCVFLRVAENRTAKRQPGFFTTTLANLFLISKLRLLWREYQN